MHLQGSTTSPPLKEKKAFAVWRSGEAEWLDPYTAFELLKGMPQNIGKRWQDWEVGKDYSPELVADLKQHYAKEFSEISYVQWVAEDQTMQFKKTADKLGIKIWGDVPFYVGPGEVWAHREVFNLDADGNQLDMGGAPPSDTSATGQMWGNATYYFDPVNNPERSAKTLDWCVNRLVRAHKLNGGMIRLDHFIGYAEPYIIAADAENGQEGYRGTGMGQMLFERLVQKFGYNLPFCPEDLGEMTEKTPELRDAYGLLTSKVAVRGLTKHLVRGQEAYKDSINNPDNYTPQTVGFAGNHDTPTLVQAINGIRNEEKFQDPFRYYTDILHRQFPERRVNVYTSSAELAELEMIRVLRSLAAVAFLPVWDVLHYGVEARYNVPARVLPENWSWRISSLDSQRLKREASAWRAINELSNRSLQTAA